MCPAAQERDHISSIVEPRNPVLCDATSGGAEAALDSLCDLSNTKYTVKLVARIGDGNREKASVISKRVVRQVPKDADGRMALELGPDKRHLELFLTELDQTDVSEAL